MSFQSPWLLLGLLAIPLLVGFYITSQRRRRAYAVRFTNLALLNQVAVAQLASIADPNGPKSQNYAMVILLTDGTSNTGIDAATAAGEAAKTKIPVQTVGIGQRNQTTMVQGRVVDGVDEQTLQQISTATGGRYYYAADEAQLSKIYSDLGSKIGWVTTKLDLTVPLLAFGTIILVAGGLFSLRWFRLLP